MFVSETNELSTTLAYISTILAYISTTLAYISTILEEAIIFCFYLMFLSQTNISSAMTTTQLQSAGASISNPESDFEMSGRILTLDERAVVLGMAVLIDFDYFSHKSGHGYYYSKNIL